MQNYLSNSSNITSSAEALEKLIGEIVLSYGCCCTACCCINKGGYALLHRN